MQKAKALKIRRGDRVLYGSSNLTQHWHQAGGWYRTGIAVAVTPRGGVKIMRDDGGGYEWVPYHHIGRAGPGVARAYPKT